VREAVLRDRYQLSPHVHERMRQRQITQMDIVDVLLKGRREKRKDEYDEQGHCWKYAWRGMDEQAQPLRVIVRERAPGILIITAINIGGKP
jgi:hypothetical protein